MTNKKAGIDAGDQKSQSLQPARTDATDQFLTTNQGLRIADDQNSLKAGPRGPTLLEDFLLREKITHFDHERIPERVVHARGEAAHGYFQVYESMAKYSKAGFLQSPEVKTPVFVRFSTVAGSRGSADTVRDVRGFAVKFYTDEGNFDLVGNNIPVFFIQDAIKFPDLVHAVKPEPHNEMPQAASAHDTFWDFISLTPEAMHMIMWVMSDRSLPRSLRMMEGFGVHTFRFINAEGKSSLIKFHWKPLLGAHALVWDEAQILAGKDPDFHRRDLWEAIEAGDFPEWEFGVQIFDEADQLKFGFDVLDPTKLIPEELVPVTRIGKMTLNRNPDNFFAETEQVAFHPGHVVPGIDFSNDPLLQGRLFSYLDTQLLRLGGPNFHQIPINRALAPVHNNQRDGLHQHQIPTGRVSYEPNSLGGNFPREAAAEQGGFVSYAEPINAEKIRIRSETFSDHFSQATLFFNSQSPVEQQHVIAALQFELSKVDTVAVRERMLTLLNKVDADLAKQVGAALGLTVKAEGKAPPSPLKIKTSAALSMAQQPSGVKTRKVAILAADGVDAAAITAMKSALTAAGVVVKILAPHLGQLKAADGQMIAIDHSIVTMPSVLFDAVFVPGGAASVAQLLAAGDSRHFVMQAFKHCKAIAVAGEGVQLLDGFDKQAVADGVLAAAVGGDINALATDFIQAIGQHRFWQRAGKDVVPA